jgi:uncharacterized membrane protein
MEVLLSRVLRAGVMLSACLMSLGLALMVVTGDTSCPTGGVDTTWFLWGDPFFAPSHVLFLGFLVLIATPVLRIMASIVIYLKTKDWSFVVLTTMVLLTLLVSFTLGI